MEAMREQARAIVRDIDEIKDLVCSGGAAWAVAGRLVRVKQAAARLSEYRAPEDRVLAGYRSDVHGELHQLHATIAEHGCGFVLMNRDELQLVMLAAENFVERTRRYLGLADRIEGHEDKSGNEFAGVYDLTQFLEEDDAA